MNNNYKIVAAVLYLLHDQYIITEDGDGIARTLDFNRVTTIDDKETI